MKILCACFIFRELKGKQYKAYVEEKKEAKRIYDQAVQSGIGAAHVAVDARDSNRFTVSVNIEPFEKVIFNLTYEQLLVRKHSKYEMIINLHPGQLVKDLNVDVYINETKPLLNIASPALRSGNEIVENLEKGKEPLFKYKIILICICSSYHDGCRFKCRFKSFMCECVHTSAFVFIYD